MFIKAQASTSASEGSTSRQLLLNAPLLLIGGKTTLREDIKSFRALNPDVLIGTPGRLEEFLLGSSSLTPQIKGKKTNLGKTSSAIIPHKSIKSVCIVKELEMLVLDEADRLLELGFQASINRLLSILPKQRRTGCFSATMSEGLGQLCRVGLRNPVRIIVKVERKHQRPSDLDSGLGIMKEAERNTPASLRSTYTICETEQKMIKLLQLLENESKEVEDGIEGKKIIVYFATCACVDYFYKVRSQLALYALGASS